MSPLPCLPPASPALRVRTRTGDYHLWPAAGVSPAGQGTTQSSPSVVGPEGGRQDVLTGHLWVTPAGHGKRRAGLLVGCLLRMWIAEGSPPSLS